MVWLLVRGKSPVEHCVAEMAPSLLQQPPFFNVYQTQPETLIHTQYVAQQQQHPQQAGPYIVQHQQY